MKQIVTTTDEQTKQLAQEFAKTLKKGDVVTLQGDLGAGKTTFVQGVAEGLGITKHIISPTFIIMRTYVVGSMNFYHVDLYRIHSEKDIEGLGLLEIIKERENIVIIEWPEKIEHLLPDSTKKILFTYIDEKQRKIIFE